MLPIKAKRWVWIFAVLFLMLIGVQLLFETLQGNRAQAITLSVRTLLREESAAANPEAIARSLESMESLGFLRCAWLKQVSPIEQVQLDLRFKGNCVERRWALTGQQASTELEGVNGSRWELQFFSANTPDFLVSLWLTRVLVLLLVLALAQWHFSSLDRAERMRELEVKYLRSFNELASQVAHDIRSPLAAIRAVDSELLGLPEQTRILLRGAVTRLQDIAAGLLKESKKRHASSPDESSALERREVELIPALVDQMVSEKRIELRVRPEITIQSEIAESAYQALAEIDTIELKRILSNLMNNAAEALAGAKGEIRVRLSLEEREVLIEIKDNGKGIAPDVLQKLGPRGETFGKKEGSGLGLYHARTTVEKWGGRLELHSEEGAGTSVLVRLPRAVPPPWFVSEVAIPSRSQLVLLDDDSSIHEAWLRRLSSFKIDAHGIRFQAFSHPEQLRAFVRENVRNVDTDVLYLMDQELIGFRETGLDLIAELGLAKRSILITSRFEDELVRKRIGSMGVRMIPKLSTFDVPLKIVEPEQEQDRPDAVLVDDDPLVHLTWKVAAKAKGKRLLIFSTGEALLAALPELDRSTPLYVDADLGNGARGEDIVLACAEAGFSEIHLATGYDSGSINPEIRVLLNSVRGKEPAF